MGEERSVDVSIFISHKHEDEAMARAIKEKAEELAGPQLRIFLSEDISIGANWFDVIRKNLEESNLLVLLFTDPGASWDWCLYEAGLFQGFFRARDDKNHHVACLHHPQIQPPGPLQHLQAVPAKQDKMEEFLERFWYDDIYTGKLLHTRRSLPPPKIKKMAKEICNLITRKPSIHYYSNYLRLNLSADLEEELKRTGELPNATPIEAEDDTLEIFDLLETPPHGKSHWTVGDLKEIFPKAGQGWLWEIGRACHAILHGKRFVVQARFRSPKDNKIYRPLIHREEVALDSRKFLIVFFEDLVTGEEIPEPVNTILVTILVAYRIRYEVIEYFLPRMLKWTDKARREKGCEEMIRRLTNIEQAAEFQRYISPAQLHESFKDAAEEDQKIKQIYDKWWALRENLDSALIAQDIERIHRLFQDMLPVHEESVRVTARQFRHYVASTYGEE